MSEALMTIGEFAEMLGPDTQIKGAPGIKFSSVSFDSRSVRPNGLFLLLKESGTVTSSCRLPPMRALPQRW